MHTLPTYTLLYDDMCRICTAQARGLVRYDTDHRLALLAIDSPAARARYPQIAPQDAQRWMHIVGPDGRTWRGADAVRQALLLLPLGRALGALLYPPGDSPRACLSGWAGPRIRGATAPREMSWRRDSSATALRRRSSLLPICICPTIRPTAPRIIGQPPARSSRYGCGRGWS